MIKCGKCQQKHQSVAMVKACYSPKAPAAAVEPIAAPAVVEHACEDWDGECFVEGCDEEGQETWGCRFAEQPKLIAKPIEAEPVVVSIKEIPASKYALVQNGQTNFFEVQVGKGKWQGYRFVKRLVGAPGEFAKYPIPGKGSQVQILEAIAGDFYVDNGTELTGPMAAAVRFSREFTRCACCLAPLSDPISIAQGLGPVCAKRF